MPIRPIDMQTVMPKGQQNKQAKQTHVNRQDNALAQTQKETKTEVLKKSQTVNKNERKDQQRIKREDDEHKKRGKRQQFAKGKKKKKQASKDDGKGKSKKEEAKTPRYPHIDLKI